MKNKLLTISVKLGAVAALLITTGCAEYHRLVLSNTEEKGSEFTRTLAKEYGKLGEIEQNIMYDDCSANYYYLKAIKAKEGCCVGPTKLEDWRIDEEWLPELISARQHLMRALHFGAREISPKLTAHAQSHFDCWVEQVAEGWQKDDIAYCRSEFYRSMAEVELMLMGGEVVVMPASMVLFGLNSAYLNAEAMAIIEEIAHIEKTLGGTQRILLIGRTDRVGDLKHNKNLSKQRARAVKKALIEKGVPSHLISIKAVGETPGPKVDAHNRRVDIIFLKYNK